MSEFGAQPKLTDLRIVLPDLHGNYSALRGVLTHFGALDDGGVKQEGFFVAQVGDLMNMCSDSRKADAEIAKLGNDWIDMQIIGNHDVANLFDLDMHRFVGCDPKILLDPETVPTASRRKWQIAGAIDGWLLTHAGLHPQYQLENDAQVEAKYEGATREDQYAAWLQDSFVNRLITRRANPYIDSIGIYGPVSSNPGGVLWLRPQELSDEDWSNNSLRQICGHTVMTGPFEIMESSLQSGEPLGGLPWWFIDVGCGKGKKCSALTKTASEDEWHVWEFDVPERLKE